MSESDETFQNGARLDESFGSVRFVYDKPIPRVVRKHGKIVDPSVLEAGDLILSCNNTPSWISKKIQQYLLGLYDWDHSKWHHAIVSGGGIEVCEATVKGVRANEFWHYMDGNHEIKIRRLKTADSTNRAKVAYFAASEVGTAYGFINILKTARAIGKNNFLEKGIFNSKGVICSQLYFEACMRVGILLIPGITQNVATPAHLSASQQLEDVPFDWVMI